MDETSWGEWSSCIARFGNENGAKESTAQTLLEKALFREVVIFFFIILLFLSLPTSSDGKPNVVILFADNLAYDDVGTFQTTNNKSSKSKSRTPRTDALASQGLKHFIGIHPQYYVRQVEQRYWRGNIPYGPVSIPVFLSQMQDTVYSPMKLH